MKHFRAGSTEVDTNQSRETELHVDKTRHGRKLSSEQSQHIGVQRSSLKKPDTLSIIETVGTQRGSINDIFCSLDIDGRWGQ